MDFQGRNEFSTEQLVLLATTTADSALAPGGLAAAPGYATKDLFGRDPHAWRFRISDIPPFVARRHNAVLDRARGAIWVVFWTQNSACAFESRWLGKRLPGGRRGVLFLSLRAESLWVQGEPTFNAVDDIPGPHMLWERDSSETTPTSARDLRVFLAVYPRLAGVTPWREGSAYDWAVRHRDSANTATLRGRFQVEASGRLRDQLNRAGSPLAGVWRGEGTLGNGDSLHFWMRLPDGPNRYLWPGRFGLEPSYTGPGPFDSIPPPVAFSVAVGFASTRDDLPARITGMHEFIDLPFAPKDRATSPASWGWIARFVAESRRAELYRNDSLTRAPMRTPSRNLAPFARQVIALSPTRDSLFAEIKVRDSLVARWTAHRMP